MTTFHLPLWNIAEMGLVAVATMPIRSLLCLESREHNLLWKHL